MRSLTVSIFLFLFISCASNTEVFEYNISSKDNTNIVESRLLFNINKSSDTVYLDVQIFPKNKRDIESYSLKVRILPGLAELALGKVLVSELKEVDVSDLLGRYEVEANQDLLNKNIKNKVVMITGAGGSIGSEITRQVTKYDPEKIIILDVNEYALYEIKQELEQTYTKSKVFSVIANVTNQERITEICSVFGVNTIYHTAAYKHVPMVEENPFEAIVNNILGTKSCVLAAIEAQVETFVLISTDKAVRPTNIMGATKRFSELILQALSFSADTTSKTRMTMVRFGNVLGSSGSAIPLFQRQIKDGGPVTVTDPEVTRYFMTIPEASNLVLQASEMAEGGEVFILDMGEQLKIYDLARKLIHLSGRNIAAESGGEGIEIIEIGLRPGEKMYEELLISGDQLPTESPKIFKSMENFPSIQLMQPIIEDINIAITNDNHDQLLQILQENVEDYNYE